MSTFSDGLKNAIRTAYCSQVSNSPTWFANLRNAIIPADVRQVADNLNNWVCGAPSDDTDFPNTPFEGGQCAGAEYTVRFLTSGAERRACNGFGPFFDNFDPNQDVFDVIGPITQIEIIAGGGQAFCSVVGGNVFTTAFATVTHAGGVSQLALVGASSQSTFDSFVFSTQVIRTDGGGPDDCGNPEAPFPPVAPIEINIDFDYGDMNEFNFAFPLVFAPVYVALDGTLNIPISIGEIGLTGNINLNNDFDISLDFSGGGDSGIPDDPDLPTGDPGEDGPDPETPNKESIIGVMVRATDFDPDRATLIPQSQGPDIIAPRCASVKFLAQFGNLTGWTPDIAVKSVREYVPCPIPSGAAAVQVTADFGSTIAFTPIRGRPAAETP